MQDMSGKKNETCDISAVYVLGMTDFRSWLSVGALAPVSYDKFLS